MNVGAGLAGSVFVDPVWSVVPPTLTEFSEWPWSPGAGLPSGGRGLGAELGGDERGLQPAEVVDELAAVDRLAVGAADGDSGAVQRVGDQRRRVVLVDDVGGVEAGHLRRRST